MAIRKKWVVLFGGAGREHSIERIISEGIDVRAIAVPAQRSVKLENAVSKLKALQCSLIEVDRVNMSSIFQSFRGCALLSIGFPYLITRDVLKLFSTCSQRTSNIAASVSRSDIRSLHIAQQ